MKISDLSIKNPVMAWMLMFGLIGFGIISFNRLGISQLPDVDFPVLNVSISLPGASPELIEMNVVDLVEDALTSVEGIKSLSSSSKSGQANITIEFNLDKDIDVALQDVQTRVAQVQKRLPKDVETPVITKTNPEDQPIIWLALTSTQHDRREVMKFARSFVKDQFTVVPGVGDVFLGGYSDPVLRVQIKPEAIQRYNITVNDVIDAIQSEHSETPGGQIDTDKKVFNLRVKGESYSIEEFKNIVISKRAGSIIPDPSNMVRISQVAEVFEDIGEPKRVSRMNLETGLGLGIRKQRGSNAVAVADGVKARMIEVQQKLPEGMKLTVNFDNSRFVKQSINELNKHLVLAVILTSIVCWVFLGSWSATFNVLLSIPTSLFGAFIGLYFLGFTLNTFTLLGLTLAIGIVVDDAIMVLENIFRYNEKGYGKIESAILGAREITFAAIAATAAVVAIFLPVAFMNGVIGKFFMQFGVTISLSVLLSLLEALTITPMRSASFVGISERTTWFGKAFENGMKWTELFYRKSLSLALNFRKTVVFGSLVAMVISFYLVKFIPKEFTPQQESGFLIARVNFPVSTSANHTNQMTQTAEEWLLKQDEVRQVYANIGGFGGGTDWNTSVMFISLKDRKERKNTQSEFANRARKELSKMMGAKIFLQDPTSRAFGGGGRGQPIEFMIIGDNWEELAQTTEAMMDAMEKSDLMVEVDSNYQKGMPEIQLIPDRFMSAQSGVSMVQLGKTVGSLIGGTRVGSYAQDGHRYDIYVELNKSDKKVEELKRLQISNSRGNLISLGKLVEEKETDSLQAIYRFNRSRAITITAGLKTGISQQQALNKIDEIAKTVLKPGFIIEKTGNSQAMKESFGSLIFALIMGLAVAYMIIAAQFNSFIDPVTILMALPYSISGAFIALQLTQQSINIYSMIGVLLLMGIVKKNSILLVEFANHYRKQNKSNVFVTLVEACPVRLRPILMTSAATVAGAIPSALASGDGSETVKPMAITLIGGVVVSTLLTLYVIPCLYMMFERFKKSYAYEAQVEEVLQRVGE